MSEILVITCPSGKQNSHLLPLLYSNPRWTLRLAAHSTSSATALGALYPNAQVVPTDLASLAATEALVQDAAAVYHVGPSFHSRERKMGFNMIDAAVAETRRPGHVLRHFVYASVLGTQICSLVQHELKARVEERLYLSSELNWMILQPENFMDTFPVAALALAGMEQRPVMRKVWNVEVRNSMVALRDLAEAAARVLEERDVHCFGVYPLSSTGPMSFVEVADIIGRYIGKEVETTAAGFDSGVEQLLKYLFGEVGVADGELRPDLARDAAERLIVFANRRGLRGNPNVLRWLLGREPTSMEDWVRMETEKLRERD